MRCLEATRVESGAAERVERRNSHPIGIEAATEVFRQTVDEQRQLPRRIGGGDGGEPGLFVPEGEIERPRSVEGFRSTPVARAHGRLGME